MVVDLLGPWHPGLSVAGSYPSDAAIIVLMMSKASFLKAALLLPLRNALHVDLKSGGSWLYVPLIWSRPAGH